MTSAIAEMAKKTGQKDSEFDRSGQNTDLDRCYHQIGISAVAAAARYQGSAKNPAYAPAPASKWHELSEDAAA